MPFLGSQQSWLGFQQMARWPRHVWTSIYTYTVIFVLFPLLCLLAYAWVRGWLLAVFLGAFLRLVDQMYEQLLSQLQAANQEHLLTFWSELDQPARQSLARQLDQVDLAQIQKLTTDGHTGQAWADLARRAGPPTAIRLADRPCTGQRRPGGLGSEALAAGQVALVIVAGGQGTRLGFDHPKGMFPIGPFPLSRHALSDSAREDPGTRPSSGQAASRLRNDQSRHA